MPWTIRSTVRQISNIQTLGQWLVAAGYKAGQWAGSYHIAMTLKESCRLLWLATACQTSLKGPHGMIMAFSTHQVMNTAGFHLHLLVFPFVYWFNSMIVVLAQSSFANDGSEEFQQHFSITSKSVCCGSYMKKNVAFTLISFVVLIWNDCLSVQLPFESPVQIPVQLLLEQEVNLQVQNVIELEF